VHRTEPDPVESCPATSAADAWLRAVLHGDHRVAWSLVDPDLRRAYAHAWISQSLGRTRDDALADRLAIADSNEPVWVACVRANGELWRTSHKYWAICGWQARPVDTAPELGSFARVALAINQDADARTTCDELPLQHFLMRRRDAWRIAGIGQSVTFDGLPTVRF
jgi:hypothetical protein